MLIAASVESVSVELHFFVFYCVVHCGQLFSMKDPTITLFSFDRRFFDNNYVIYEQLQRLLYNEIKKYGH